MNLKWLTNQEQEVYDRIVYGEEDLRLMRASLDDEDVAVIVAFSEDGSHEEGEEGHKVSAEPLAVVMNEDIFNRLVPPENPIEALVREVQDRGN